MGDVTVYLSGTTAITLDDYVGQVFQRTPGDTEGPVTVTGTYTGLAPRRIEARVRRKQDDAVLLDWTVLTNVSGAAGAWSGTLEGVPQGDATDGSGGAAQLDIRHSYLPVVTGDTDFYVGINVALYGQSNTHFMVTPTDSPDAAVAGTRWLHSGGATNNPTSSSDPDDWEWMAVPASGGIRALLNRLCTLTGVPVGGFCVWQDATAGAFFTKEHATPTLYNRLLAMAEYASGMEALVIHQGESDTGVPPSAPATRFGTWANYWRSIKANLETDLGYSADDIHMAMTSLATTCTSTLYSTEGAITAQATSDFNWMHNKFIQQNIEAAVPGIKYGGSNTLNVLSISGDEGIHWAGSHASKPKDATGRRAAQAIAASMGAASSAVFKIASAEIVDSTHIDVHLTHGLGTDFTPTSDVSGFEVSFDNGATRETPSAAVRQDSDTIRLTITATSTPALLYYQWGNLPPETCGITGQDLNSALDNAVIDNGALSQPLEFTGTPIIISGGKPSPVYINGNHNFTFTVNATVATCQDVDIGVPHANRLVPFCILTDNNQNVVSLEVTPKAIDGTLGTPVMARKIGQTNSSGRPSVAWFDAELPDGWMARCVITYASSLSNAPDIVRYNVDKSLIDITSPVFAGATQASGASLSVPIATEAGSFILAGASLVAGSDQEITGFSGGTEVYAQDWNIGQMAHLGKTANASPVTADASNDVVVNISGTGAQALGCITYPLAP